MGGPGSGGWRSGAGRPKIDDLDVGVINGLCDSLAREEIGKEILIGSEEALPEYTSKIEQFHAGDKHDKTFTERNERRNTWFKMPVGREHVARVRDGMREDQGLDEDDEPNSHLRFEMPFNHIRLEAKVKRLAQEQLRERFSIDVSTKTIGRVWQRGYRSSYRRI